MVSDLSNYGPGSQVWPSWDDAGIFPRGSTIRSISFTAFKRLCASLELAEYSDYEWMLDKYGGASALSQAFRVLGPVNRNL